MSSRERLNQTVLAIGASLAAVFSVGWVWAAADDRVTSYRMLPAGEPVTVVDTTWQLESMAVDTVSESSYGQVEHPPSGAVFVFVTIAFDSTAVDARTRFSCRFALTDASELEWQPDSSFLPASDSVKSYCEPGRAGTVQTRFTVPGRLLDRIVGVSAAFFLDGEAVLEDPVVLPGTLSR